ncbi:hypothetical protein HKD37_15G044047 [Glycine soja]
MNDHIRIDLSVIAHNIVDLVKTNPGIQTKTLIVNMLQHFGYTSKYLPIWRASAQHFVPGTIVRYKTSNSMEDGEDDSSKMVIKTFFHSLLQLLRARAKKFECDMGAGLLVALRLERVRWIGSNVTSVYCIFHIASNFNKEFKNVDLKKTTHQYGAIRVLTSNKLVRPNSVLKETQPLAITVLVKETFNKINDSFVTNGMKIMNMIKAGYGYSEKVYVMMQENRHIATSHYIQMYVLEVGEFEVQEITNT